MALTISDLYQREFQIRELFIMEQTFWRKKREYGTPTPRPTDALLYFEGAKGICHPKEGNAFRVEQGGWVYIARGAEYRWEIEPAGGEEPVTWLFNFNLTDPMGNLLSVGEGVQPLHPEKPEVCRLLFKNLLRETLRPQAFPAAMMGHAYALLAELVKGQYRHAPHLSDEIRAGIRYLENDIAQKKSVEEIAAMCHMSLSSFEKQFKAYAKVSPREYRLERRLERAELLLRNSPLPVWQIAQELGFYDAPSFCKLFKKKKGLSPSELRK